MFICRKNVFLIIVYLLAQLEIYGSGLQELRHTNPDEITDWHKVRIETGELRLLSELGTVKQ